MQIASELGFEDEDLHTLGIDLEMSRCNAGVCKFDLKNFKNFEKTINNAPILKNI